MFIICYILVTKMFKLNSEVMSVDEILLKEANKILIEEDKITDSYNYTLLNNILSLLGRYNYTFSIDAIDMFCRLEWNYRVALLGRLNQLLYNESKISHENPDKFYINYPNEVNSGDKRELYINSLLYYYFNFWKSDGEESLIDKPELTEDINLKELDFVFQLDEEEVAEDSNEENDEEISEECSIQDTIKEIEMALAGGRNMDEEMDDPYSDDEEAESPEDNEEDDEEDIEEDILSNQFLNPYEEENEEESDEEPEYEEKTYEEENYEKYEKKYNGRYIDELVEARQYLKLLKLLKKEPNELARRILFVVEGIYYKYEDKNERLKNLSKSIGVFEGVVDCISGDMLETLIETLQQRVKISSTNSKLRKLFNDLIEIVIEEFEDRKN